MTIAITLILLLMILLGVLVLMLFKERERNISLAEELIVAKGAIASQRVKSVKIIKEDVQSLGDFSAKQTQANDICIDTKNFCQKACR